VQIFFLLCVVVAGLFGGITAKATILFTQALPGALALALVLASRPRPRETG
jgi:putative membrane protein